MNTNNPAPLGPTDDSPARFLEPHRTILDAHPAYNPAGLR